MSKACIDGDPWTYPGELRVIRTASLTATYVGGHVQYLVWLRGSSLLGAIGSAKAFFACPEEHRHEFDMIMDRKMDDEIAAELRRLDEEAER
jgi:hypothetical protein